MKVLLIYPRTPDTFWSFKYAMPFISKRAAFPPLGLLTIVAMMPADWQFKLVDLNVRWLSDNDLRWADYVMISAMIVHKTSVLEIADRCRRVAKPMIAGGPLFTTGHADFPGISHFVLGEAEAVMAQLIEDMDREFLINGYRQLMKELYALQNYYERIRTFLEHHALCGPQFRLSWSDLKAFAKSVWLLGIVEPGRFAYWRFSLTALLKRPCQFYRAMELAILGYHFRRVASRL